MRGKDSALFFFKTAGMVVGLFCRKGKCGTGVSVQTAKRNVHSGHVCLDMIGDTFLIIHGIAFDSGIVLDSSKAVRLSKLVTRRCSGKCSKLFVPRPKDT